MSSVPVLDNSERCYYLAEEAVRQGVPRRTAGDVVAALVTAREFIENNLNNPVGWRKLGEAVVLHGDLEEDNEYLCGLLYELIGQRVFKILIHGELTLYARKWMVKEAQKRETREKAVSN